MIIDSPYTILYIHPKNTPSEEPVEDELTELVRDNFEAAVAIGCCGGNDSFITGTSFMGVHQCTGLTCDAYSESCDYLLPYGIITNSLCVHYIQYHRDEIPENELQKIRQLSREKFPIVKLNIFYCTSIGISLLSYLYS